MKKEIKLLSFFLILLQMLIVISFADPIDLLKGHWAEKVISKDSYKEYSIYFTSNSTRPDDPVSFGEYVILLYRLCNHDKQNMSKEELYKNVLQYLQDHSVLSKDMAYKYDSKLYRKDAVMITINYLRSLKLIGAVKADHAFVDINKVSKTYKQYIGEAYNLKIISGDSSQKFYPDNYMTKIQAVLIMERLKKEFFMKEQIPFKVLESKKYYSWSKPLLMVEEKDKTVLITITRRFSNPGYSVKVLGVSKASNGEYVVELSSINLPSDVQLQVITYISTTIEINKEDFNMNSKITAKWDNSIQDNSKVDM